MAEHWAEKYGKDNLVKCKDKNQRKQKRYKENLWKEKNI